MVEVQEIHTKNKREIEKSNVLDALGDEEPELKRAKSNLLRRKSTLPMSSGIELGG